MLWQWLSSRNKPPQLPVEEDEPTKKHPPLTGWKVLYLWFPAFCDLTGTTVCAALRRLCPTDTFQSL